MTVTVEADLQLTAVFIQQFTLTVDVVGQGFVEFDPPREVHDAGTIVMLRAEPFPGWQFDRWRGDLASQNTTDTLSMDVERRVTAVFVPIPTTGGGGGAPTPPQETVLLTVATTGAGDVSVTPEGEPVVVQDGRGWLYAQNAQVTLAAVNTDDACFFRWGGDADSTEAALQLTVAKDTFVSPYAESIECHPQSFVDPAADAPSVWARQINPRSIPIARP